MEGRLTALGQLILRDGLPELFPIKFLNHLVATNS